MNSRVSTLLVALASAGCFSPDPAAVVAAGSTGTAPEDLGESSGPAGEESGEGSEETTDEGTSTGGESGEETTGGSSGNMESSSSGDGSSEESGSSGGPGIGVCGDGELDAEEDCDDGNNDPFDGCDGACAMEACGYDFSFVESGCRTEAESYCVPESFENEMQAACEACTGVPCEEQACSLGFPAGAGTIWTPIQDGGGFIEHPMGFVDSEIRYNIGGSTWSRGTILLDGCSEDRIGTVEF